MEPKIANSALILVILVFGGSLRTIGAETPLSSSSAPEGHILWKRPVADNLESTPAIDKEGNIYVAGGTDVISYDASGEHRWTTRVGRQAGEFNSPSISHDQKCIYGGGCNFVYALDADTGKTKWINHDFKAGFHSVPTVSKEGTRLYFGIGAERDEGDSFYCIDAKTGHVVWEYVTRYPANGVRGHLGGAILDSGGTIYLATQHGWLISLTDVGDHFKENWAYNVGAEMRMPPSLDLQGFLYVGSSSAGGYIHKVNSKTGKSAGGNWPVKTTAGEVFTNISIGNDGSLYANSEDHRLWAFHPDGTRKWNNLQFESWGSDPLVRNDGTIVFATQINHAARVVGIRDLGDRATIEWTSKPIARSLRLNETNVNIAADGTLFITTGQASEATSDGPQLYAIKGNGEGLSKKSPWPKFMGSAENNGSRAQ